MAWCAGGRSIWRNGSSRNSASRSPSRRSAGSCAPWATADSLVERISIDEAFADVAGCTHLFGSPPEIASAIRRRVRAELGLPISIGVARTKHLAKIASQVAKPDGLVVVDPETELDFLHDLPVELMWGVGPVTQARLAEIGVHTIGQLAKMPGYSLERLLGHAAGEKLSALGKLQDGDFSADKDHPRMRPTAASVASRRTRPHRQNRGKSCHLSGTSPELRLCNAA